MIKNTRDIEDDLDKEVNDLIKSESAKVENRRSVLLDNNQGEYPIDISTDDENDSVEQIERLRQGANPSRVNNVKPSVEEVSDKDFAEAGHFENEGSSQPNVPKKPVRSPSSKQDAYDYVEKRIRDDDNFGNLNKDAVQALELDSLKALRNPAVRKQLKAQIKKQRGVFSSALINDNSSSWLGKGLANVTVRPLGAVASKVVNLDYAKGLKSLSKFNIMRYARTLLPLIVIASVCLYTCDRAHMATTYPVAEQQKMTQTFLREAYLQDQRMGGVAGIQNPGLSVQERVQMIYDASNYHLKNPGKPLPDSLNVDIQDKVTPSPVKFDRNAAIDFINQAAKVNSEKLGDTTLASVNAKDMSNGQLLKQVAVSETVLTKNSGNPLAIMNVDRSDSEWQQAADIKNQPATAGGVDSHIAAYGSLLKSYTPQDDPQGVNPDQFKLIDGRQAKMIHDLTTTVKESGVLPKDMKPFSQPGLISPENNMISKEALDKIRKSLYGADAKPSYNADGTPTDTNTNVNNPVQSKDSSVSTENATGADNTGTNTTVNSNPMQQPSKIKKSF